MHIILYTCNHIYISYYNIYLSLRHMLSVTSEVHILSQSILLQKCDDRQSRLLM